MPPLKTGVPLFLRLARREMRGGARGVFTFLACLALGVAAIASVGTVTAAFKAAVTANAAEIMGGDVEVSLSHTPLDEAGLATLARLGKVSQVVEMRAMASTTQGPSKRSLVSLKAVDGGYPLLGRVALDPAMPLAQALAGEKDGLFGAAAHPDLLLKLGAKLGDVVEVGDARFRIRAVITGEPDRSFRLLAFGPRLLVSREGMERTGLAQPGSMVRYEYRVALPPGADPVAVASDLRLVMDDPGVRVRNAREAAPSVRESFNRLGGLMALVGLSALLLGGLGVSEGVAGYLEGKTRTIATYKAIGASGNLVFWVFLPQIMALALAGIAAGLAVGAALGWLAAPVLAQVLPVAPEAGVYPVPLAVAGLFGLLTALAFALPPLSSRTRVSPLTLFRGYAAPGRARPGLTAVAVSCLLGAAMAGLVLASAPDSRLGWGFLGAAAACSLAFWVIGKLLAFVARILPVPRDPRMSLAMRGLHRPGSPTGAVVACLGLGLTVLSAVTLSDANFQNIMLRELPEHAPSFFFLDVQPYQLDEFERILASTPGVTRVEVAPSLRGRIVSVKGVPVERLTVPEDVSWAVRGDRSLSWAREMPAHTALTAGKWWPEDYSGKPLVSMDSEVAKGLGLGLGDTLTVSVLGREVELTVASLRRINWLSLSLNHVFILSPGVLDGLPVTYLATAYVAKGDTGAAAQVYDKVGAAFGNVSIQRVDEALEDVSRLAEQIALAVRVSAAVTLAAGLLVLAQSLRAAMARRVYETVIYKVCGASRRDVMAMMLVEHGLAGLAAGAAALALGAGLSWFFGTRYMNMGWHFFAGPALIVLGSAMALTLLMSLAGMWRTLSSKAWPYLRNE